MRFAESIHAERLAPLKTRAQVVLAFRDAYRDMFGELPKVAVIVELTGLSKRTVQRALRELRTTHFIPEGHT